MLLPVGWMPMVGANGLVQLTLCAQPGQERVVYATSDGRFMEAPQPDAGDGADTQCDFAIASAALLLGSDGGALLGGPDHNDVPSAPYLLVGQGLAAPPPPAHGPPVGLS